LAGIGSAAAKRRINRCQSAAKAVSLQDNIHMSMMHRLSIGAIIVSVISLIVFTAWPHHHHDGMICMKVEMCIHDLALNDCHTSHHAENTAERQCMAENNLHSLKVHGSTSFGRWFTALLLLLCCFAAICGWQWLLISRKEKKRIARHTNYVSFSLGRQCGLRAPPSFVC